ncbi:hypothetical protein UFOVP903_56 [uncultured Caudovirales phage]|uniref:Uncharacterized protein n=1 Tax=uncultured Caudovirales phage TaxID=2100421 RepID=A0A6J5PJH1_9CAUD|nr:hypothetical protein UFOVP903_56 [uncultured Caudovirales phage]CAB4197998.1 hypothetical protein UFOVP1318_48 [uncultured Caudovirales phage]CAB4210895.1 hypothetical protein UFOVP1430_54 [uncultured Caudovirales phage]
MAKKARKKKLEENEFGEQIEIDGEDESSDDFIGDESFAKAEGSTANAHAKKLAKRTSVEKKTGEPRSVFYTMKGLYKIIKVIVKARGVYEVYVGSLKRNKVDLETMIKLYKKEGTWVEPHAVKQAIEDGRKGLK